jgi:hypothetical protein
MKMMIKLLNKLFSLTFILVNSAAISQNNADFNVWSSLEVSGNLPKKITLNFQVQSRFDQQVTHLKGIYYNIDASKKIKKKWSIEGGIRLNTSDTWNSFRIRIGLAKKIKISKFDISFRGLYQVQLNEFGFDENYRNLPISSARFRFQVERKLVKHLKMNISTEPLWRRENMEIYLRRIRNSIGLAYEINKNLTTEISYLFQPQFYPQKNINIISISLSYDLPHKKKKKEKKTNVKP